jgi:hypothetical protein
MTTFHGLNALQLRQGNFQKAETKLPSALPSQWINAFAARVCDGPWTVVIAIVMECPMYMSEPL